MMDTGAVENMNEILLMVEVVDGEKMVQLILTFPGLVVDSPPVVVAPSPVIPSVGNGQDKILIFQNGLLMTMLQEAQQEELLILQVLIHQYNVISIFDSLY